MKKLNKKGFTLIELLVVIAIIGLLSTLAVVAFGNTRIKARDAKRQSDLKVLQTAVEMYITENAAPPAAPAAVAGAWAAVGTSLVTYLPAGMPEDPQTRTWCYCEDGTQYLLVNSLEQSVEIAGDLDTAVAVIAAAYTLGSDCICSDDAVPVAGLDCDDSATGNVDGAGMTAFCLGSVN